MKEYVEITLNEQWQKECGVRWTVTTQQTLSVSNHHHHGHGDHHHHGHQQRIRVQTWYNIEVRSLTQMVQQVVVPVMVPVQNQAPPQYAPAVVQGNGTEGGSNGITQNPVYQ